MHESSLHRQHRFTDEERTRCEVWTRVMGYHRPVAAFNPGKQAEHSERRCFEEDRARAFIHQARQGRAG